MRALMSRGGLIHDLLIVWQARVLLAVLIKREIAGRNTGTVMGIAWSYLSPLLTVGAYYLVFDVVFGMRLGPDAPIHQVGAFLIVGALPWMAFCDAVSRGMGSLLESGGLLQKNALPPVLFVVKNVVASTAIFGPLMTLVVLSYGPFHGFSTAMLSWILLLALQVIFSTLLGYFLAILAAALRDIVQLVGFMLGVGIYLTPVLYPMQLFPEQWNWVLWLNPMTGFVLGYQELLLQGRWPPATVWVSACTWIVITASLLDLAIRRSRDQLVDWL